MKYVKSLPRNAVYDGEDLFGGKFFHTRCRLYKVFVTFANGKKEKTVLSFSLHEKY